MHVPLTIRFRLTLWYSSALAILLLASGGLIYGVVHHRLMLHYDEPMRRMAIAVEHILNEEWDCHTLTPAQTETLDKLGKLILFHEAGAEHGLFYQSPEAYARSAVPDMGRLGWKEFTAPHYETVQNQGMSWRILSWPYQARSGRRGVIRLMQDLEDIQETLQRLRLILFLLIPAGIGCSALAGYWLSGQALAPVDRIARMAREIEAHRLDRRLPHPGAEDEIGRLVETLNHMIGRLESSFGAMKRFTADAAHELRNPLATMRNTIDVVLEQPRTLVEQRSALESLGEDVDRLRKIVEDLLLLARADSGRLVMEREVIRMDLVAQAMIEIHEPQAQERGIHLILHAPDPVEVLGDERWLYRLLANLLDNALKFTPPQGSVTVELLRCGALVQLSVSDTGPGIPEADLPQIFDRFYQADPARAQKQGTGLGLAIAAWVAESHGGRLTASNQPEGGARFIFELPTHAGEPA